MIQIAVISSPRPEISKASSLQHMNAHHTLGDRDAHHTFGWLFVCLSINLLIRPSLPGPDRIHPSHVHLCFCGYFLLVHIIAPSLHVVLFRLPWRLPAISGLRKISGCQWMISGQQHHGPQTPVLAWASDASSGMGHRRQRLHRRIHMAAVSRSPGPLSTLKERRCGRFLSAWMRPHGHSVNDPKTLLFVLASTNVSGAAYAACTGNAIPTTLGRTT